MQENFYPHPQKQWDFSNTGSIRGCPKSQVQKPQLTGNGCPEFNEEITADLLEITTVHAIFFKEKKCVKEGN